MMMLDYKGRRGVQKSGKELLRDMWMLPYPLLLFIPMLSSNVQDTGKVEHKPEYCNGAS